ncbi:MAG: dATP/dGTP pyrophosphohydrolase domain-containing protein [Hypericibacter sp.]
MDAVVAKQAVNEQRSWPDWRTADPDKAIEHVREWVQ